MNWHAVDCISIYGKQYFCLLYTSVMDSLNEAMDGLYQVRSTSMVKVSISCIVGKNGSGKSSFCLLYTSLIDIRILYRLDILDHE